MASVAQCSPAEIIRQLHLQAGDELLDQEIVWACASCETCTNRCPMGIDGAAIMDALRKIAQYFYPQRQTKMMNEGCASFVHHRIMTRLHEKGRIDVSCEFCGEVLSDGSHDWVLIEVLQTHDEKAQQLLQRLSRTTCGGLST